MARAAWIAGALLLVLLAGPALAQGLTGAEAGTPGWGARLFAWMAAQQAGLQRELASLLGALKRGEGGAWWGLVGGSFLYGVLHAAGPGHGKLVISSYLFANHRQLRSGLSLTLVSSLLQAVAAILLVGLLAILLDQARLSVARNVQLLEIASYALIVLLGLAMLWRALRGGHAHHGHAHDGHGHEGHQHLHGHHHAFGAPPTAIPRRDFWAMALAVGVRPCTGAVIVLLFTFGQRLVAAGIAATFAMAVGTALTVGVLALLAVGSRRAGLVLAGGESRMGHFFARAAALGGALAVTLLGALLLWATWTTPPSL